MIGAHPATVTHKMSERITIKKIKSSKKMVANLNQLVDNREKTIDHHRPDRKKVERDEKEKKIRIN